MHGKCICDARGADKAPLLTLPSAKAASSSNVGASTSTSSLPIPLDSEELDVKPRKSVARRRKETEGNGAHELSHGSHARRNHSDAPYSVPRSVPHAHASSTQPDAQSGSYSDHAGSEMMGPDGTSSGRYLERSTSISSFHSNHSQLSYASHHSNSSPQPWQNVHAPTAPPIANRSLFLPTLAPGALSSGVSGLCFCGDLCDCPGCPQHRPEPYASMQSCGTSCNSFGLCCAGSEVVNGVQGGVNSIETLIEVIAREEGERQLGLAGVASPESLAQVFSQQMYQLQSWPSTSSLHHSQCFSSQHSQQSFSNQPTSNYDGSTHSQSITGEEYPSPMEYATGEGMQMTEAEMNSNREEGIERWRDDLHTEAGGFMLPAIGNPNSAPGSSFPTGNGFDPSLDYSAYGFGAVPPVLPPPPLAPPSQLYDQSSFEDFKSKALPTFYEQRKGLQSRAFPSFYSTDSPASSQGAVGFYPPAPPPFERNDSYDDTSPGPFGLEGYTDYRSENGASSSSSVAGSDVGGAGGNGIEEFDFVSGTGESRGYGGSAGAGGGRGSNEPGVFTSLVIQDPYPQDPATPFPSSPLDDTLTSGYSHSPIDADFASSSLQDSPSVFPSSSFPPSEEDDEPNPPPRPPSNPALALDRFQTERPTTISTNSSIPFSGKRQNSSGIQVDQSLSLERSKTERPGEMGNETGAGGKGFISNTFKKVVKGFSRSNSQE